MVRTMATENVDYECESTVCEYCGKKISAKRNLMTHVRNIHGIDPSTGENTPTLYLCEVCGNELSAKSSLDRHLKVVHGIEPEAREKKFECSHCTVSYVTKKSLAHHVRLQHSVLTSPSEDSSTEDNSPDNKAKHLCSYCGKIYCKAYSLKQHVTKVHGIEEQKIPSSICSICDAHVRYGSDFSKHLKSEHDIEEDIEELSFSSMADFYQWKEKMEKETLSSYSKATGTRGSQQSLRHYFACHRSGERRTHGKGKRLFNAENSVKIGKLCPSRLIVSESGNGVFVIFHKSHVGHTNCLKYLRLTRSDKELIAGKLRNGLPKKQILKEIRSGVPSERIHAIDMVDIYIIRDYNLDSDRAHPNDFVSLDMWVTQQQLLGSDCPIICYKKQGEEDETGELNTEDFLVVIMTPYQKMMLSKFTNFKVLMDSTHGTNAYDFQLTTVMIVDEFGAGVPIAFCISNKTNQSAMKRFLVAVRDAVGHRVMCQVFMSDDYPAYYNSWSQVMSVPNHKLLCSWHILRSWKNNLKKIRNDEKQVQVWQALIVILVELDEEIFHQLLEAFLEICSNDDELQSFHEYFSPKYAHSYEMWAFCYRKGLGLNTNMYLEAFHKKLK
ncbi:uncharacterized protein [Anabrus simplex]|uniref:uncharacterized protein n=1 Tax=Anabrus simplex TaxID=316456 RepID=UPI0035A29ECB